jgi:hypothetical protein
MARDEAALARVRRVGDVHDLDPAAATGGLVEHRQVGEVALRRHVRHPPELAELRAVDGLADQLEPELLRPAGQLEATRDRARGAVPVDRVLVGAGVQEPVVDEQIGRMGAGGAGGQCERARRGGSRADDDASSHISLPNSNIRRDLP